MAESSTTPTVTRKEFYSALSLIWLYIMLVIGQLLNDDAKWTLYVLFAAALVMSLTFSLLTIRLAMERKGSDTPG
jgi:hypothetical protein